MCKYLAATEQADLPLSIPVSDYKVTAYHKSSLTHFQGKFVMSRVEGRHVAIFYKCIAIISNLNVQQKSADM